MADASVSTPEPTLTRPILRVLVVISLLVVGLSTTNAGATSSDSDGDGVIDSLDTVESTGTIVSTGGWASQSSTLVVNGASFGPGYAVDGRTSGDPAVARPAVTNDDNPWWEVDLGSLHTIDNINVHTRTDCCEGSLDGAVVLLTRLPLGDVSLDEARAAAVWSAPITDHAPMVQLAVPTRQGRHVRVQLPDGTSGQVHLAEVTVMGFAGRPNDRDGDLIIDREDTVDNVGWIVSTNKPTAQSSVWTGRTDAGPHAAVDDVRDGGRHGDQPIAITDDEEPWWEVDLGADHRIDGVNIYNRTDGNQALLDGALVMVATAPFGADMGVTEARAHASWTGSVGSTPGALEAVPVDAVGRYVRIQLPATGSRHLGLAEVDVIGHPATGATPIVADGDFETPVVAPATSWRENGVGASIGAWTVTDGNVTLHGAVHRGLPTGPGAPGGQHLDLDPGNSGIEQVLTGLVPGARYLLRFSYSAHDLAGGQASGQVTIGDLDETFTASGHGRTGWFAAAMPFVADASDATLRFAGLTGAGHPLTGVLVDGVSIDVFEPTDAESAPTLLDGDFESLAVTPASSWRETGSGGAIGPWSVIEGNATLHGAVHRGLSSGPGAPGGQHLDLDPGNSMVEQAVTGLRPGDRYTVRFSAAAHDLAGGAASGRVTIGEVDAVFEVTGSGRSGWLGFEYTFVAGSDRELLRFAGVAGAGHPLTGVMIDGVTVEATT